MSLVLGEMSELMLNIILTAHKVYYLDLKISKFSYFLDIDFYFEVHYFLFN